jgi:hypothetical protein
MRCGPTGGHGDLGDESCMGVPFLWTALFDKPDNP